MKQSPSQNRYPHDVPVSLSLPLQIRLLTFVAILALSLSAVPAEVLLSCNGDPGGDHYYRGFYLPSYPGNSLDSARLRFSSTDAGNYTVILTARKATYYGTIL